MFNVICSRHVEGVLRSCVKHFNVCRHLVSKIPDHPCWVSIDPTQLPDVPELDDSMIGHLERISLVEFNNKDGLERLRKAIEYANELYVVNTDGVEPMYSVLEDRHLLLDEDQAAGNMPIAEVMKNAVLKEEDFFVAPPGNIPLTKEIKSKEK